MLRAALAALLLTAAPAAASPGSLDRGFGHHGRIAFGVGDYSYAETIRLDPAGRILLGGFAETAGGNALAVARLTPDGRLDPGYGQGGIAAPAVPGMAFLDGATTQLLPAAGGATIAAGWAEDTDTHAEHLVIARLDGRGRLDPRFGQGGATVITRPGVFYFGVAGAGRDAAGRILLLASAAPLNGYGSPDAVLIRLLADGTPDAGFGPGGMVTLGHGVHARDLLVNRDGSATVLAAIPGNGARPVHAVVYRLDARGRVRRATHLALHGRHPSGDHGPTALLRGPRGSLIVAGNDAIGLRAWGWVARLRSDGRWGRRVVPAGKDRNFHIRALAHDGHGRIVAVGNVGVEEIDGLDAAAVRLAPDGRVDRRFGLVKLRLGAGSLPHVQLDASAARAVAIDRRGRIVMAGAAYHEDVTEKESFLDPYFAAVRLQGRP